MKFRHGLVLGVMAAVLAMRWVAAGAPAATLNTAIQAIERGRYAEALAQLTSLQTSSLSAQERQRVRYLYAHAALRLKLYPQALQVFGELASQYPELGDYALWNVARIHQELNAERPYVETLRLLLARFPDSRLLPQARVALGRQLISISGQPMAGVQVLEDLLAQQPPSALASEAYWWLAQGYEGMARHDNALSTYRTLYVQLPSSPEAGLVAAWFDIALLSPRERLARADKLAGAGDCERAMQEVLQLLGGGLPEDLAWQAARRLGLCAYRLRRYRDAIAHLDRFRGLQEVDESSAEALYILASALQRDGQSVEAERIYQQLAICQPQTRWHSKALVALGQLHESRQDIESAIDTYRTLVTRFPTADRADELDWRIGWLRYTQGQFGTAAREFGQVAEHFPQSQLASNALYWQAKALEKSGNGQRALRLYEQTAHDFPYTFYGLRAQEVRRSRASFAAATGYMSRSADDGSFPTNGSLRTSDEVDMSGPARFHHVRAEELLALRFLEDAREEIAQLARQLDEGRAQRLLLARLYLRAELPVQAIRTSNAILSAAAASDRLSLPAEFWTLLFPQLYWDEIQQATQSTRLDPFLILSVIRQESAFNTHAVSRSDARGLMQLLPTTGRELYQRVGLQAFYADVLFDPQMNVRLGSQYLGRLADSHRGNLILALAAYNAGPSRLKRWLQEISTADWDEFIERLPFEETRLYVKSVLRNYGIYRRLYAHAGDGQVTR